MNMELDVVGVILALTLIALGVSEAWARSTRLGAAQNEGRADRAPSRRTEDRQSWECVMKSGSTVGARGLTAQRSLPLDPPRDPAATHGTRDLRESRAVQLLRSLAAWALVFAVAASGPLLLAAKAPV